MNPCLIHFDGCYLYSELSVELMSELLSDIVTRYESFFTFSEPSYPEGQASLLFHVLKEGYGFCACHKAIGIETINLGSTLITSSNDTSDQWKEERVGRLLANAFSRTINT